MTAQGLVQLPNDVSELKTLVSKLNERIAELEQQNRVLSRMLFAPSSERRPSANFDASAHQGQLWFTELVEAAERVADATGQEGSIEVQVPPAKKRKPGGRRRKFPEHFMRVHQVFELAEDDRTCECGGELHVIGEEPSTQIERIEMAVVVETARKKYACRQCEGVVRTAPGPERVIEGGLLGVGFLAHVASERFGNHMPYNRLEQKYASEGLDLSRSVLCRSMQRCAELLEPIAEQIKKDILAGPLVQTDDTPVVVKASKAGGRRLGRIWIYRSVDGKQYFDYTESRSRDGPAAILGDYDRYIQADAYPGYDGFFGPGKATEVGCWAHARRKYVDAEVTDPELSKEAVRRIRELYGLERRAKAAGMSVEEVGELRQREALPRLELLRDWLSVSRMKVLDKSPMGRAIDYTLSNWTALTRYTEDGRLSIDNNAAERSLRKVAVGRKNWEFIGNEKGGKTAVVLYTLVETAKAFGVDPRTYMRDVLLRVAHESDVSTLTPYGWKERWAPEVQAHQASIIERLVLRHA